MKNIGQKVLHLAIIGALVYSTTYGIFVNLSKAAGIDNVVVSLASETTGASSQINVGFTPTTALVDSDVISIYIGENSGGNEFDLTGVLVGDVDCTNTGGTFAGASVTLATASTPAYVTITVNTAGTGGSAVMCTIGDANDPTNPAVADGYEVAVITNDDEGAGVAYVGNNNDVTVTANVLPLLNLTISDNTMDLGTVLTTAVSTADHTISVGTNASSGATVHIIADGALNSGGNAWTDVVENNAVVAGTEGYGIAVTNGAGWTESANFDDDDTPIPLITTDLMTSAGAIDDTITTTIQYRAAVDATTPSGTYDQVVTYTATADF